MLNILGIFTADKAQQQRRTSCNYMIGFHRIPILILLKCINFDQTELIAGKALVVVCFCHNLEIAERHGSEEFHEIIIDIQCRLALILPCCTVVACEDLDYSVSVLFIVGPEFDPFQ